MNLLITSAGRRTQLLKYFIKEFQNQGEIIVTDSDPLAPAMHIGARGYVVPPITDAHYLDRLKEICMKEKIRGMFSLIDPELSLLAQNIRQFEELGVKLFVSPYVVTETCFDKYAMYQFLTANGFKTPRTYRTREEFKKALDEGQISFPAFVKPRTGSASIGIHEVYDMEELELVLKRDPTLLIQELMRGEELGVDVYTDILSKEIISIFAKKKLKMRAGETDKAVSFRDEKLFCMVEKLVRKLGSLGPIDIDVFLVNGEYYISEVNPRFGGGYPLAYECGENFPIYILNNLKGIANHPRIGEYREGLVMLKHDVVTIVEGKWKELRR